jgi:hypothetical protein
MFAGSKPSQQRLLLMFGWNFCLSADATHDLILRYDLLENYRFHMKLRYPKIIE